MLLYWCIEPKHSHNPYINVQNTYWMTPCMHMIQIVFTWVGMNNFIQITCMRTSNSIFALVDSFAKHSPTNEELYLKSRKRRLLTHGHSLWSAKKWWEIFVWIGICAFVCTCTQSRRRRRRDSYIGDGMRVCVLCTHKMEVRQGRTEGGSNYWCPTNTNTPAHRLMMVFLRIVIVTNFCWVH